MNARQESELIELLPALRAFARVFRKHESDADDLVQETLLKAVAHIDQFTPGTSLKSWLFTIMRNSFYTAVKKEQRERPAAFDFVETTLKTQQTQDWSVRGGEVQRALLQLPEHHREVITLVGILGVSYEDTARITGCSIGTVKSRLNRARASLMQLLGETSPKDTLELLETRVQDDAALDGRYIQLVR